jgi:mono/diheme cytochrome c family protein
MRRQLLRTMTGAVVLLAVSQVAAARAETLLERGTYLMEHLLTCNGCHTPRSGPLAGAPFAGGVRFEVGGEVVYSRNLTPDAETGIGRWSEDQIVRAIREGLRPDGSVIGPAMMFELYRGISDRDARAIAAYLKTLKPVANAVPWSRYAEPVPSGYGPPVGHVAEVPRSERIRYGAYLAGPLGECIGCHTPLEDGKPDFANRLGAGGDSFFGPWGERIAGNITPDRDTGLGAFSDRQIRRMITDGIRPNGSRIGSPMAHGQYHGLRDDDVDAIIAYLRSLKPIVNMIDK